MPTGYTADVADGKITDVKDYAYGCARAFGAFMHQRDDESRTALRYPDSPEQSFYSREVPRVRKARAKWTTSTEEQKYAEWSKYVKEQSVTLANSKAENATKRARYNAMLAQVQAIEVPAKMQGFHDFLVSQLVESEDFDCGKDDKFERDYYRVMDYVEWCDQQERTTSRDVEYYTREQAKDVERYHEQVAYIDLMAETFGFEVEK